MSIQLGEGDVLLTIYPTPVRRILAVSAMGAAVAGLLYAIATGGVQGALGTGLALLLALGLAALAARFWRETSVGLVLSRDGLRDTNGRLLFLLENLQRVDRGAFSMKPSNGLTVWLKEGDNPVWAPGLWWRLGRRVGIGGVTAPSQARAVADMIALQMAERDGTEPPPTQLI